MPASLSPLKGNFSISKEFFLIRFWETYFQKHLRNGNLQILLSQIFHIPEQVRTHQIWKNFLGLTSDLISSQIGILNFWIIAANKHSKERRGKPSKLLALKISQRKDYFHNKLTRINIVTNWFLNHDWCLPIWFIYIRHT